MEPDFHSSISYKNEVYYPKLKNTSRRDKYLLCIVGSDDNKMSSFAVAQDDNTGSVVDEKLSHSLKPGLGCPRVSTGGGMAYLIWG